MNKSFYFFKKCQSKNKPNTIAIRLAMSVVILLLLVTVASTAQAERLRQVSTGEFTPSDCLFEIDIPFASTPEMLGFTCGYVTVPEHHSKPDGPTIRIPVAIKKTTSPSARPDPLFLAQGGPGGDAFGVFATEVDSLVTKDRDVVIFNQRGTLYAEPDLICEEVFDSQLKILGAENEEGKRLADESMVQCRQRLVTEEGINLSAYNSTENAADVELIRQALGYETYNFYGVSYGTLLGLHLMDAHPQALRAVILDSVVTRQTNFVLEIARTENNAYDEYFAACSDDPVCSTAYPNLEARLTQIYANLDKAPAQITLHNDDTGESVVASVDGNEMRGFIFQLMYVKDFYAVFPRLIADLEAETYQFVQQFYPIFAFDQTLSYGMYASVICAEDSDFLKSDINLTGVRPFIANFIPDEINDFLTQCETWNVEALPSHVDDPVQSDIPTLLLSGRFDPVTPAAYAAEAAQTLSNNTNLVDKTASHGVAFDGGCVDTIVIDFLDNPMQTPNSDCLEQVISSEVVLPSAIQIPILQKLLSLKTDTLIQFGTLILLSLGLLSGLVVWPFSFIIRRVRYGAQAPYSGPHRMGRGIALVVGVISTFFIGGLTFYVLTSFADPGLLLYGGIVGSARPLFILPVMVLILTTVALYYLLQSWPQATWLSKIHHILLIGCLIGVSILLFTLRMFEPLWG